MADSAPDEGSAPRHRSPPGVALRLPRLTLSRAGALILALNLAGCGDEQRRQPHTDPRRQPGTVQRRQPGTVQRAPPSATAGDRAGRGPAGGCGHAGTPVGDVNAHAPSIADVKHELRLELAAAPMTSAAYNDPPAVRHGLGANRSGVDAIMPVGAPILAPGTVKVLASIPDWCAGQPLVYWELLDGSDAGKVQYVAEQITNIAPVGSILQPGQPIARFAASGTASSTAGRLFSGVTLARATTGYRRAGSLRRVSRSAPGLTASVRTRVTDEARPPPDNFRPPRVILRPGRASALARRLFTTR